MQLKSQMVVWLAVVFVPVVLAFAAATVKAALLSIGVFWGALSLFFYGEIRSYLTQRKKGP
ncbi:hypothetical protein Q672_18455 [Marinobacter sp. EVN1]|uniref:hypothetical protein n=1 Tax=Marinobacter TaxID=2742 RepID=UPI0003B8A704|nr:MULTISPECIES: hypothetical protein [Marinobacter]ERS84915.1 hypothetical protein Q672_18455 [Marinobacter sp. EVN1]ERS88001.1 hypothetical protein Q667_14120 [Marinobacter sp. C1S70]MBN8240304.1 hypothetical protein [Marinobacter nauticus]